MIGKSNQRFCFSLLELLAVIGIVAILCSLLLPALAQARKKAMKISCSGNLRNIGFALREYASVYEDYVPAYNLPWQDGLLPFLGIKQKSYLENGKLHSSFHCESSVKRGSWNHFIKNNYGINKYQSYDHETVSFKSRQSIRHVRYPDRRMIVADRREDSDKDQETPISGKSQLAHRHDNGAKVNILYLDGHCKDETYEKLPQNRFIGSNLSQPAYFWGQATVY